MNFDHVLATRPELFPLFIRIERKGGGYNDTGQKTGGGYVPVEGMEKLNAQNAPPTRGSGGESTQSDMTRALSLKVWTIPGRVEGIATSMRLVELNASEEIIGVHDILAFDVNCFGLHTVIETKRAS